MIDTQYGGKEFPKDKTTSLHFESGGFLPFMNLNQILVWLLLAKNTNLAIALKSLSCTKMVTMSTTAKIALLKAF